MPLYQMASICIKEYLLNINKMKTTLRTDITVRDICEGFVYNEVEGKGLFGLSGKLFIITL